MQYSQLYRRRLLYLDAHSFCTYHLQSKHTHTHQELESIWTPVSSIPRAAHISCSLRNRMVVRWRKESSVGGKTAVVLLEGRKDEILCCHLQQNFTHFPTADRNRNYVPNLHIASCRFNYIYGDSKCKCCDKEFGFPGKIFTNSVARIP